MVDLSVCYGYNINMDNIKSVVAKNLIKLRKQNKLTQMELAEKLNYSDKAISRWESGEVTPDVGVLDDLCKVYNIPITSLFEESLNAEKVQKESKRSINNKIVITLLAISLVWILATITFVYFNVLLDKNFWQVFIYGLPVTFILAIVFNALWGKKINTFVFSSLLVWAVLLSFYIAFLQHNIWPVFVLGAPMQVALILWSRLK